MKGEQMKLRCSSSSFNFLLFVSLRELGGLILQRFERVPGDGQLERIEMGAEF
jgi:hypothetical protein